MQKLIRYAKYFLTPMKIAKNRNNYGKVLAWQQFYGLILAFYFRLMHVKESPEIVVLTFIYKPKKSLIGKIYDKFMRYIVTSGYIKYFVVFLRAKKGGMQTTLIFQSHNLFLRHLDMKIKRRTFQDLDQKIFTSQQDEAIVTISS